MMNDSAPDYAALKESPLEHLGWFCEWGGPGWESLVRRAITEILRCDLSEQRVLELGPRQGRMSCLFGLLGAQVLGVDLHDYWLEQAGATARALGVESSVRFIQYDGLLEALPERDFNIVFTKSVLVVTPDLSETLRGLHGLLRPGGRGVFIENTPGGPIMRLLRRIKHHGRWDYSAAHYFTSREIELVSKYFEITEVKSISAPPVILLSGTPRAVIPEG